jgi:hypothetical protein
MALHNPESIRGMINKPFCIEDFEISFPSPFTPSPHTYTQTKGQAYGACP